MIAMTGEQNPFRLIMLANPINSGYISTDAGPMINLLALKILGKFKSKWCPIACTVHLSIS